MSSLHASFRLGAENLAVANCEYTEIHRSHGISQNDWDLLTRREPWTIDEGRQVRSVLASIIEVCLTISGLPPVPLPGQFAAAIIAIIVSPANRFFACQKVPDTFDAFAASGVHQTFEVKPMRSEQMMSLVMAYSGGFGGEPPNHRLDPEIKEVVKKENAK